MCIRDRDNKQAKRTAENACDKFIAENGNGSVAAIADDLYRPIQQRLSLIHIYNIPYNGHRCSLFVKIVATRVTSWLSAKDSRGRPLYSVHASGPNCSARLWPISNRFMELKLEYSPCLLYTSAPAPW